MRQKNTSGFSLIELLVTVAILGIIASLALANFLEYRIKAYNIAALTMAHNLRNISELHSDSLIGAATINGGGFNNIDVSWWSVFSSACDSYEGNNPTIFFDDGNISPGFSGDTGWSNMEYFSLASLFESLGGDPDVSWTFEGGGPAIVNMSIRTQHEKSPKRFSINLGQPQDEHRDYSIHESNPGFHCPAGLSGSGGGY